MLCVVKEVPAGRLGVSENVRGGGERDGGGE